MEEEDFSKLSIEDRCVHKVWKARVSGYEAAADLFRQIDDEKSPEWQKFTPLIKKFVIDTNAPAQEKGLDAALAFIENCAAAGRTVGDVMTGIVQKCVAAPKAKTKELATQICLMYIEIEKQDNVLDELLKGTESKNPKISAACVHIMSDALRDFGAKVVNVSRILKRVTVLLEDRDSQVRSEAKLLLVEIYKWLGPTLKPQLAHLKPIQMTEMEAEFAKIKESQPRPTRLLKSQQAKKAQAAAAGGVAAECDDDAGGSDEVDPFDLLDPVDVLGQLPKNFYTQIDAKKWTERKEALEALEKTLAAAPKIENGDYGDLIRALKKMILKDSNVVVVVIAIRCVTGIANGLKKKFHPYAVVTISALFEKFKEKKQNVVAALRDAVDAAYASTTLELILEDVITNLDNKNPSIKSEVSSFLARCFTKSTPQILNKKMLKPIMPALIKALTDQDPGVRDSAAQAIGTAMKVVGEKGISPYLKDIDPAKMAKVKECYDKAEIIVKPTKARPVEPPPTKPAADSSVPKPVSKPATAFRKPIEGAISSLSREEALSKSSALIPDRISADMSDESAQLRARGYTELLKLLKQMSVSDETAQVLLAVICSGDCFETNAEVLQLKLNAIKFIASSMPLPKGIVNYCGPDLLTAMSIPECGELAGETLWAFANASSVYDVAQEILGDDAIVNQPKLWAEALNWVTGAIMKTGVVDDSAFFVECGTKAMGESNSLVKNAGLALIGTIHVQVGAGHVSKRVPDSSVSKIHKSSSNSKVAQSVAPQRSSSAKELRSAPTVESNGESEKPRIELKNVFTDQLINELTDKNWKMRGEAVAKIQAIVNSASAIGGNLGDAPVAIAARITDSNSKIAASAITLVESLAVKMGPSCKQHLRIFLPSLLKAMGDAKVWIRTGAIACLNAYGEQGGYKEFFESEMIADALKTGSPTLRSELWAWLAEKLPNIPVKTIPKDELTLCLPILYTNVEDRNADVRKNALDAVLGFMIHLGYSNMVSASENIKVAGGSQVKQILEKTRAYLPEKPAPKPEALPQKAGRVSTAKLLPGSSATITKAPKPKGGTITVKSAGAARKKEEDQDASDLLKVNNLKHQRVIDEQKLKTIKWNFVTPRAEFVDLLRDQMTTANFNKTLIANMFHSDFKFHLKAIDSLSEDLPNNLPALTSNLDLILRWMTLRFFDTNPSVINRGLDYLISAFTLLKNDDYSLLDSEAAAFVPYLILKAGDAKDNIQKSVRDLFDQIRFVYPASKLFMYLNDGVKSKNSRQRTVCLDLLNNLIDNYGPVICHPSIPVFMKDLLKHMRDRDTMVRGCAFRVAVTMFVHESNKTLALVHQLSEKDGPAIEEKLRKAAKNRPRASCTITTDVRSSEPSEEGDDSTEENTPPHSAPQAPPVIEPPRTPTSSSDGVSESPQLDVIRTDETYIHLEDQPSAIRPNLIQRHKLDGSFNATQVLEHSCASQSKAELQCQLDGLPCTEHPLDSSVNTTAPLTTFASSPSPSSPCPRYESNYALNEGILNQCDVENIGTKFPELESMDLRILDEGGSLASVAPVPKPTMTPTLSNFPQATAIKYELAHIASSDIEKALAAMAQIDTVLSSDKRSHLSGFVDYMVNQLVHQLIILNQSSHPEVVKCYHANFALLTKLCTFSELCDNIAENNLYKVVEQLLLLLGERKLETFDKGDLFTRVVNHIVYLLLDNTNKTNLMCALVKMLHDTISNPGVTGHFQDLVLKCLWKLNRNQAKWDEELDYPRILLAFQIFLKQYPSAWWKAQTADVPLRTIKTLLHSMVKFRGVKVQQYIKEHPSIPQDSELSSYATKVIKHLKITESHNKETDSAKKESSQRLSKEAQDKLSEIFRMIGDPEETEEGFRQLYNFQKSNPEADLALFLSKTTVVFQQFIKKGLVSLEERAIQNEAGKKPAHRHHGAIKESPLDRGQTKTDSFGQEADQHWSRLSMLQQQAGFAADKKSDTDSNKVESEFGI